MSSWIQSLKAYHTENKSKYRVPKKDSEEYQSILKYHQGRTIGSGEEKKENVAVKKAKKEKATFITEPTKKTAKKTKKTVPKVVEPEAKEEEDEDCFSE